MSVTRRTLGPMISPRMPTKTCRAAGRRRRERGAVMVEFLIAFLPTFLLFLGLVQSGLLFTVRLVTQHAATTTARAAAVVIGDDPKRYDGEPAHQLTRNGKRSKAVRNAALITLSPLILNGTVQSVDVAFPARDKPGGPPQDEPIYYTPMGARDVAKIRVRLGVEVACRIPLVNWIACPPRFDFRCLRRNIGLLYPTQWVEAEAIYPYQGALYGYDR